MKTGLLWFDDNPRKQLEEKVLRAAMHYEHKYGQVPNLCFVHPSALGDNDEGNGKHSKQSDVNKVSGVEIRTGRSVLPHHFWLGTAAEPQQLEQQLEMKLGGPPRLPREYSRSGVLAVEVER